MADDAELTANLRAALAERLGAELPGVTERRMMGGHCFMLNGNMVCCADRSKAGERRYMFRTGKGNPVADDLPGGEITVMGDRVMSGIYFVAADSCDAALLKRWLNVAVDHAESLPPK